MNTPSAISIHALRGEGDMTNKHRKELTKYFNPRPPWGGRHERAESRDSLAVISIHALRGEGDDTAGNRKNTDRYFNPRPPWGGRLNAALVGYLDGLFQSTPSVGRATLFCIILARTLVFQSTPSVGRATKVVNIMPVLFLISIHALRGEGDL